MRRRFAVLSSIVAIGAASVAFIFIVGPGTAGPAGASSRSASSPATTTLAWGAAAPVPGLAALNRGGNAEVSSVSCASAGNCAVGGSYAARGGTRQAFIASEVNGVWGKAVPIPGLAALNTGGDALVSSVSCASAGDCAVGGSYTDAARAQQAFVANETHGSWRAARALPGLAALNTAGDAAVNAVSCASAGACAVGGFYTVTLTGGLEDGVAFIATEVGGIWSAARLVPGTVPGTQARAEVNSLSCRRPGDCAAGGRAQFSASGGSTAFVVTETGGTWGKARDVAGLTALDPKVATADIFTVSCASPGNCAAGGTDANAGGSPSQPFVVTETRGAWGRAQALPGLAALNTGGYGAVESVFCASAGNCTVGGFYAPPSMRPQAFVAAESRGRWGTATRVPGLAALDKGHLSEVNAVSCASAGNCDAGGFYTSRAFVGGNDQQAFVVDEHDGAWRAAVEVPGTAALNKGNAAAVNAVSCVPAGECAAGGFYNDGPWNGFVVSKSARR